MFIVSEYGPGLSSIFSRPRQRIFDAHGLPLEKLVRLSRIEQHATAQPLVREPTGADLPVQPAPRDAQPRGLFDDAAEPAQRRSRSLGGGALAQSSTPWLRAKIRRFSAQSGHVLISHRFASAYSHPLQSRHLSFTAAIGWR